MTKGDTVIFKNGCVSADDWDMSKEEFKTLMDHSGRRAVVECKDVDVDEDSGYYSIVFADGFELNCVCDSHLFAV